MTLFMYHGRQISVLTINKIKSVSVFLHKDSVMDNCVFFRQVKADWSETELLSVKEYTPKVICVNYILYNTSIRNLPFRQQNPISRADNCPDVKSMTSPNCVPNSVKKSSLMLHEIRVLQMECNQKLVLMPVCAFAIDSCTKSDSRILKI